MNILGLSAHYHDSAACLVRDGAIVAAAQEERFTRRKHDASFPRHAAAYCLRAGGVGAGGLDAVVFYEKPLTHFVRLLETSIGTAPFGLRAFLRAIPVWLRHRLWLPLELERELAALGYRRPRDVWFTAHHESHAASAFFPSPFPAAAVLTADGVGEWATSTIAHGRGHRLTLLRELRFPHSLGLLYSAFTSFCGFRVNSGEYKLMGLAPYGEPRYAPAIRDQLLDLRPDGSFRLNLRYFDYLAGERMEGARFAALFGGPARAPEGPITRREVDLARSIQAVTEEILLGMARTAVQVTGERRLCLAGGVALNCVANGRLLRAGICDDLWIQPAAGDAGGALGAALYAWHEIAGHERAADGARDAMGGAYLGPAFDDDEIRAFLDERGAPYEVLADAERADRVAALIDGEQVVGLFLGRMEFGPRALGHRSIVADPRSATMQSVLNLKVKHRESFRPFAPSVLEERAAEYFDLDRPSPYMLLVAPVRESLRRDVAPGARDDVLAWVKEVRSALPAITHVDWSARVQTVSAADSPEYHAIIEAFARRTGCGVVVNTSFNVRGEPIVCTPADAYRCFMHTEIDHLVLGRFLLAKPGQPPYREDGIAHAPELD